MEKNAEPHKVKIINVDSAYYGKLGTVVTKDPKLPKNPGYLVKLPNGEIMAFGPSEVEFIH